MSEYFSWVYVALLTQALLFMYGFVFLWRGIRRNNLNDLFYGNTVCVMLGVTMALYIAKLSGEWL